jgi:GNAT superfamily N-acetyltransferase
LRKRHDLYLHGLTAEFAKRIEAIQEHHPYLVAEQDGTIFGYAYAGAFKPREAYALSAELSVYVDSTRQGKGVGRALYAALEDKLAAMDVTNLYACVGLYPQILEPDLSVLQLHEPRERFGAWQPLGRALDALHVCFLRFH